MVVVGEDFRDGILFVPEVLLAANAMKAGMALLEPILSASGVEPIATMVIGTVKGDIHDIGQKLVGMMMEGAGVEVYNLGVNNDKDAYINALEEHNATILGMSALLTTTMPYMKVVVDELKARGIRDKYIIMVGGAPLNDEFAEHVGADAYCMDAGSAVETMKKLVAAKNQ
jgi:5-methyltetrahydrofolate--homocysteine methyltransferase